jgi:release factor glutamine methyltransferase
VDWIIQSTKSEGNEVERILEREAVVSLFHWLKICQMPKYMRLMFLKRLFTAKKNAVINQVDVTFIEQNILETADLNQQFDIIVSNPPYVRNLEKQEIKKNVLDNEPHLALCGR